MKKILIILSFILVLSSCTSEKEQNAAATAAAMAGAEDYTITHAKDGEHKELVVTLKNLTTNDPNEKMASSSVLTIFGMITKEDYKDYDRIKIEIERDTSTFREAYDISKLEMAVPILKNLLEIFRKDAKNNYPLKPDMVDFSIMKDSVLQQFNEYLIHLDDDYGKLSNVAVVSFSFKEMKESGDNALIAHVLAKNGLMLTNYTFFISLKSKKIFYIGINDEE